MADEQNGDDTSIHLSRETMEAIFRPTLDGLVSTLQGEFSKLEQGVDIMFLVGGFSTSPVLRQRIEKEFGKSKRVKKIVMPPRPGAAILKGAASFGVNPSVISARRSRLTYGVSMSTTFEEGVDLESKRFWSEDWKEYKCNDRFRTVVKAGARVLVEEKITVEFKPAKHNQINALFQFFSTSQENVRYIDEPGVTQLGELTVEMPFTRAGLERIVEVTFSFGETEIKVEAIDRTSGNEYKTSIRFSSSY